MACYIASNDNRFYAVTEQSYGATPLVAAKHRFPALKLALRQTTERLERKDKTGSRTFPGIPSGSRRETSFELRTYLTSWMNQGEEPGYGPLFQAAMGGSPVMFPGATAAGASGAALTFTAPHQLAAGQAVTFGGEMRFVTAILNATSVLMNAAFSATPGNGSAIGPTVTYFPADRPRSASIFDYWSPGEAVQRIVCGAGVDKMQIRINGDFHEFWFSGAAADVIDSSSFSAGQAQLASFPAEPEADLFDYAVVPGHLGQAWLGNPADRFFTLTWAEIVLNNDLDLRSREFGSMTPRCLAAGQRSVTVDFELYETGGDATKGLYQAARQRSPIEVMFQLGQDGGQLFGAYLKSVVPEAPEYDDSETRLRWRFSDCRAQGTVDDEIVVAFG